MSRQGKDSTRVLKRIIREMQDAINEDARSILVQIFGEPGVHDQLTVEVQEVINNIVSSDLPFEEKRDHLLEVKNTLIEYISDQQAGAVEFLGLTSHFAQFGPPESAVNLPSIIALGWFGNFKEVEQDDHPGMSGVGFETTGEYEGESYAYYLHAELEGRKIILALPMRCVENWNAPVDTETKGLIAGSMTPEQRAAANISHIPTVDEYWDSLNQGGDA